MILGPNQLLRKFLCFSSRYKDLIWAYLNWEIIIAYVESVQNDVLVSKCGFFQKQHRGWGGGSSATARKLENFPIIWAWKLFPSLSLPQTFTSWISTPLPSTYTLSERQSSQSGKIWKQGKNLELQSKLIFWNSQFQSHLWIGKDWEVQLEQHS